MGKERRQWVIEVLLLLGGVIGGTGLAGVVVSRWIPGGWMPLLIGVVCGAGGMAAFYGLKGRERGELTDSRHQEEFTRTLLLIVGLEELLENGISRIKGWLRAEKVAILVGGSQGEIYAVKASLGYDETELEDVALPADGRLVKWLYTNETYLVPGERPEVTGYLGAEERELLERLRVDVVLPLVAANRLVGVILVSEIQGADAEHLETAWALVPPLALAVENASLYEQQRLRLRRLYRTERLATIGQLAAGAAHEIRNPLASIRSTIQYLKRGMAKDPENAEMVADLIEETDRINAIVEGMLAFARPAEPRFETVDLAEIIGHTARLVEPMARKCGVEIETRFPEESMRVRADADQLKQVFLNVVMNGVQAMPEGGRLTVSITRLGSAATAERWQVDVVDTGAGIVADHLEKIFDPFFTTKKEGTGLGLSICHAILEAHGGQVAVESELGQGTRVEIRL